MKKIFSIAVLIVVAVSNVLSQDLTIPKKVYTDTIDFSNAPKRMNSKFPLSDQKNIGKWQLLKNLSDEFNSKELNFDKWFGNNPKWKGRKPTYFHKSNIKLDKGELVVMLNKHGDEQLPEGFTHTTGFIVSKQKVLYGYFEAEMKLLDASWVSGFWLSNAEKDWWTEIDICENCPGVEANRHDLNSNVHVFRSPENQGGIKKHIADPQKYYLPFELQAGYHVWGLDWTEKYIRFYIDGILFREVENTLWHQPLFINFNCESNKWFGALPNNAQLDKEFHVNYFRVWKSKH